jgi:hypothetical protein
MNQDIIEPKELNSQSRFAKPHTIGAEGTRQTNGSLSDNYSEFSIYTRRNEFYSSN